MAPSEERLALVFSNSDYGHSQLLPLPGVRQDARSIAQKLVRLPGFADRVCFAENLSRRDMIIQLTKFQEKILQADNTVGLALIYFAGARQSSCLQFAAMQAQRSSTAWCIPCFVSLKSRLQRTL